MVNNQSVMRACAPSLIMLLKLLLIITVDRLWERTRHAVTAVTLVSHF